MRFPSLSNCEGLPSKAGGSPYLLDEGKSDEGKPDEENLDKEKQDKKKKKPPENLREVWMEATKRLLKDN